MEKNNIAVFTNLDHLALEIASGCGISYREIVDFFEEIDAQIGDSVFTDLVRERFKTL